jgi:hypothetical protein
LSDTTNIATPALFSLTYVWNISFTFNLFVSLNLKWVCHGNRGVVMFLNPFCQSLPFVGGFNRYKFNVTKRTCAFVIFSICHTFFIPLFLIAPWLPSFMLIDTL